MNIVVAWGIALVHPHLIGGHFDRVELDSRAETAFWEAFAPPTWMNNVDDVQLILFASWGESNLHGGGILKDPDGDDGESIAIIDQMAYGWPLRSMHYVEWTRVFVSRPSEEGWDSGALSLFEYTARGVVWEVQIPLWPHWPGFAINTLLYAAILWLLIRGPFVLRRWRRIKRGLCPACAYPVGASNLCTECGKPVRASTT